MKRKNLTLTIIILLVAVMFLAVYFVSQRPPATTPEKAKQPMNVTVQSASVSSSLTKEIEYPATITGDQEIKVTAQTSGTAKEVNYNLGDRVQANATLVRINDTNNNLLGSAHIQQAQLSVDQAEKQFETASKAYKKLKDAYEAQKKDSEIITKAQVIAAEGQVDVAEIQLESAKVALKGDLDDLSVTSPINGYIVKKSVSVGDSVSAGQELYTISKTSNLKIQFFVNQDQLSSISEGMIINVKDNNKNTFSAIVKNISPDADGITRRFLVEAFPQEGNSQFLNSGTIVTIVFSITEKPNNAGNLLLPISAITIGQNESYLFLAESEKAKKVPAKVVNVSGETAEIQTDISPDSMIIIHGSKLVADGDQIIISR